jgi:hypothetical protein
MRAFLGLERRGRTRFVVELARCKRLELRRRLRIVLD